MSTIAELSQRWMALDLQSKNIAAERKKIQEQLKELAGEQLSQARATSGKENGAVNMTLDKHVITETRRKSVSWDLEKLNHICNSKPDVASAVREITKWEPKIDEKKFLDLPVEIKKELLRARKVSISSPSFNITAPVETKRIEF